MPPKRGSGRQNNAPSRGQAPNGRGRGRGGSQNSRFADYSQPTTVGVDNSEEYMVLDFNDMGALSGLANGSSNRGRGRGFNVHAVAFQPTQSQRGNHQALNRGRGRGRGGYIPMPVVAIQPPVTPKRSKAQNNFSPPFRGRGGGLGFVVSPERPVIKNWDLATRPLLKPIKFVRAKERLFEADPEELLQAHKIPPHPSDQLDPQTDRLAAVFDGEEPSALNSTANTSGQDTPNEGENIVIQDITQETTVSVTEVVIEQTRANGKPAPDRQNLLALLMADMDTQNGSTSTSGMPMETNDGLFFVDTTGQDPQLSQLQVPLFDAQASAILGEHEPDEIILVPSPATRSAPRVPTALEEEVMDSTNDGAPTITMENLSLNFSKTETEGVENKSLRSFSVGKAGRATSIPLRARKEAQRRKRDTKWTNELGNVFGFKDGREGLREGDSDLYIGSSSSDEVEDNGMEVDAGLDAAAMARFARGVGAQQMSTQDVEIEAAFQAGDLDSDSEDDDDDDDDELEMNEAIVIQDDDEDEDWSSDDEDVDMTPNANFKARLKRVRERTPGFTDAEADQEIDQSERTWADRDEDFLVDIETLLDDNAVLLSGTNNRKSRKALFKAISTGDPDHPFAAISSRHTKKQDKDVYDFLAEQWQRDRNKKGERKQQREALRAEQGGLGNGKVKGKGKNRHVDLEEVEQMMRDLLTAVGPGSRKSFDLPPMDKPMRVKVHSMAAALSLKSTSSGSKNKESKSMTISRSKNTGLRPINEGRINATLKRKGGGDGLKGIREGEVIGHQAARISEDNRGYKLLAQMGWSEGDKIGREGGLDAPLIAVMKKSKLGLGHSASRLQ